MTNFVPTTVSHSTPSATANEWLLPDGVHDVLFFDADKQEHLRQHFISQLQLKGYDLVSPPLIEFTESLLGNASEDLKRQTFKIIDQLTGRLMGVRADTTPQILRIDANCNNNTVNRYCYAGHTIQTLPKGLFGLRTPLQLGAEIFGCEAIEADFELLDTACGLFDGLQLTKKLHLDLGHVGIFARLTELAQLSAAQIDTLNQLYTHKALPDLKEFCQDLPMGDDFFILAKYGHSLSLLQNKLSTPILEDLAIQSAFAELQSLYGHLNDQPLTHINISIDVSDLSGYRYHSSLMFHIYLEGTSQVLLRGGRFYGQAKEGQQRPAVGFSMDITRLFAHIEMQQACTVLVNFADINTIKNNAEQQQKLNDTIDNLRSQGYRVVRPLTHHDKPKRITHTLSIKQQQWILEELA